MSTPRLFPDFAAVPTPTERRRAHAENLAGQVSLFGDVAQDVEPTPCHVCAGIHPGRDCRYGIAVELFSDVEPVRCDRTYSNHARNPYHRRTDAACMACGVSQDEHRYPTAEECGADNVTSNARADRTYVANGHTGCPDCDGDLTDEHHWSNVDIAGKVIPWEVPDMFRAAHLAAMPTAARYNQ